MPKKDLLRKKQASAPRRRARAAFSCGLKSESYSAALCVCVLLTCICALLAFAEREGERLHTLCVWSISRTWRIDDLAVCRTLFQELCALRLRRRCRPHLKAEDAVAIILCIVPEDQLAAIKRFHGDVSRVLQAHFKRDTPVVKPRPAIDEANIVLDDPQQSVPEAPRTARHARQNEAILHRAARAAA